MIFSKKKFELKIKHVLMNSIVRKLANVFRKKKFIYIITTTDSTNNPVGLEHHAIREDSTCRYNKNRYNINKATLAITDDYLKKEHK